MCVSYKFLSHRDTLTVCRSLLKMQIVVCVCFIAAFVCSADGQGNISETCKGRKDFERCLVDWTCDLEISQCFCKSETPYCRCNNYIDEFYLGKSCSQKWTTLSFALVATFPGVTLALVIGVAVHLAHTCGKSSKSHRAGNELSQQNLFPGVVFASDLNSPPPLGLMPAQVGVPMVSSRPYSSAPNNTQPALNRLQLEPSYSLPPSSPMTSVPDRQQLYSYMQSGDQVLRNPYNERSVSAEPHHQPPSPHPYNDQWMAPAPTLHHGASEYRSAFPRAQISRPH